MVHLLGRFYPTDTAARVTADADAGMETVAAADATFHTALLARGYRLLTSNHYEAPSGDGTPLSVDLFVPGTGGRRLERIKYAGRGFDAIPGLTLALASDSIQVRVRARLTTGEILRFEVPVSGVEQAVVLKRSPGAAASPPRTSPTCEPSCRSPTNTETGFPTGNCTPPAPAPAKTQPDGAVRDTGQVVLATRARIASIACIDDDRVCAVFMGVRRLLRTSPVDLRYRMLRWLSAYYASPTSTVLPRRTPRPSRSRTSDLER